MNQKAKKILEMASTCHSEMQIDSVAGKRAIDNALKQIQQQRAEAKRDDLVMFCDRTSNYLESMNRHGRYLSVFSATLDNLGRVAEMVREEPSDIQAAAV